MALLTPLISKPVEKVEALQFANELLASKPETQALALSHGEIHEIFEEAGIGIRNCARILSSLAHNSQNEQVRLSAVSKAMDKLIPQGAGMSTNNGIQLVINAASGPAQIANIFNPQR